MRADEGALPFASASFDTVLATFPSDYIAAETTIVEIRRVLRPGGTVAIAVWARFADDSPYARLVDVAYRLTQQRSPRNPTSTSIVLQRFAALFERAGLETAFSEVQAPGGIVQYVIGTYRKHDPHLPDRKKKNRRCVPQDTAQLRDSTKPVAVAWQDRWLLRRSSCRMR